MSKEEELFASIGNSLKNSKQSKLFGKPCFKIKGKAFCCFYENEMVFKLSGDKHKEALALKSAQLFDPSKKNRPMKEWVQVPFEHKEKWKAFARAAMDFVATKH